MCSTCLVRDWLPLSSMVVCLIPHQMECQSDVARGDDPALGINACPGWTGDVNLQSTASIGLHSPTGALEGTTEAHKTCTSFLHAAHTC